MTTIRKLTALLLSGLLLLSSCGKDSTDTPSQTGETVEKTQILTNVFKGTRVTLPEETSVNTSVTPYYDKETGDMTVLSSEWIDHGDGTYGYEHTLITFAADGTLKDQRTFGLEGDAYINQGTLTKDSILYIHTNYDEAAQTQTFHAAVYSLADGSLTLSDDVTDMFSPGDRGWFYVQYIAQDADGYLYLGADQEVVVLDANFIKQFSIPVQSWVSGLTAADDGTVYISDGDSFSPIDKSTKSLGQPLTLPDSFRAYNVRFGEGYDLFCSNDDGLYGYNFPEAGAEPEEPVLLCNYPNSDLIADNLEIARILSPDRFLVYERDPESRENVPVFYDRSADIDLSQIKVLEIAYTNSEYNLPTNIVNFNKSNDGIRIIPRDYSLYNTTENRTAGEQKLANDILNGLYKPDLVTGYTPDDTLTQIYENNLYVDLYPLMTASGKIAKDDILGCVTRSFEDKNGGLWALGSSFSVQTLMGTKAMLGDRTGWTLSEMIDFAKSLPEGTELFQGLSQESARRILLGQNGYGMFLDTETNTCNFETEEFLAYLDYLATLPKTNEEAVNATASATGVAADDYDNRYLLFHNGQVALKEAYYYGVNDWVGLEANFNTPDVVHIGYPTADGKTSGSAVTMCSYVITSFCEYPAEAWSFLETLILPQEDERSYGSHEYPVLKEAFMKNCAQDYESLFEVHYDGSMSWGSYSEEELDTPMDQPGYRSFFTEEDATALMNWLDTEVGAPVADTVDEEISAIIEEEISSYLGGTKTAQDCAKIIQSRVSLWLSEHE